MLTEKKTLLIDYTVRYQDKEVLAVAINHDGKGGRTYRLIDGRTVPADECAWVSDHSHTHSSTLGWADEIETVWREGVLTISLHSGNHAPGSLSLSYTPFNDTWKVPNGTPEGLPFTPDDELRAYVTAQLMAARLASHIIHRVRETVAAAHPPKKTRKRKVAA